MYLDKRQIVSRLDNGEALIAHPLASDGNSSDMAKAVWYQWFKSRLVKNKP